jgi:electron transport complex protein RnfB
MMSSIAVLTVMGVALGTLLGIAAKRFKVERDPRVDKVESLLPGTNCGQCGFPGCSAAAEAVTSGQASTSLCPPGGRALAEDLSETLGLPLELPDDDEGPKLARVDESLCIGCIKCFKVCPTDAIVGAPKQIHVVMDSACTGCGKCVDVCPTECVTLESPALTLQSWRWPKPAATAGRERDPLAA